jgi:hypothetical protein
MLSRVLMASGNITGGMMHLREAVLANPLDDDVWYNFVSSYCRFKNSLREKQNAGASRSR